MLAIESEELSSTSSDSDSESVQNDLGASIHTHVYLRTKHNASRNLGTVRCVYACRDSRVLRYLWFMAEFSKRVACSCTTLRATAASTVHITLTRDALDALHV